MKIKTPRTVATLSVIVMVYVATAATTAWSAVTYDGFDYASTTLVGQNGGTGWNGAYFNTVATDNTLTNDGVSLSYPATFDSPFTTPATTGSTVRTGGLASNASSSRLLSQTIPLNVDGTVRYVSALFQKNRTNGETNNDNVLLEFVDANGNRRWGLGIEGPTDKPWLNANGSLAAATAVNTGQTYFMVAKIVSSAAGTDSAFLKVFGTGYSMQVPVAEPIEWDVTLTETTAAILDRIRIRVDSANTALDPGFIDEIRVATTWAEAVGQAAPGLNGDFNSDGKVDAADYVTWRENDGTTNALPNDNGLGTPISSSHYDLWRANFGNAPGSGSSLGVVSVPEPATFATLMLAGTIIAARHRQRARRVG